MDRIKTGIIKDNSNTFGSVYRLIDICIIHLSIYLSTALYAQPYSREYFMLALLGALGFALIAESFALYRSWRVGTFKEITFYTFVSWALSGALVLIGLFFTKMSDDYSRVVLAIWFVTGFMGLVGWRAVFKKFLHSMRKRGHNTRSIALFGLSEKGIRLAREAQNNPEIGYKLNAVYDDRSIERLDPEYHSLIKGNVEAGIEAARNNQFDVIYIALPIKAQHRIQGMLEAFGDTTATVHVVPDLFMYCLMHGQMAHLGDVQTISVYDNPMSGGVAAIKRLEDILLSVIALAILAIPLLVIASAIKLTSKGPVIFKQDRYGLNGRKIKVWKFRSMKVMENSQVVTQASKDDPRITKLGKFLRRTSLDELPQFINVLKGDMSVIGPRPHAVAHNETYRKLVSFYMLRHKVKPGITGWAQVNGWRGETDSLDKMQKRIEFDLEYIRNWSLWLDFKILVYTVMRSFTDKNAY
ncbi:undecaprenyl-phosphate glucose phosphotransferase [Glaciecola siphonariae]|uniref:Undecaprenyl-phosphate glucose phosphotransferase n=1 Tax=Glaciecola siphonariae TaxID=521012 RepID=A0ABV9LXC0_9ALTE